MAGEEAYSTAYHPRERDDRTILSDPPQKEEYGFVSGRVVKVSSKSHTRQIGVLSFGSVNINHIGEPSSMANSRPPSYYSSEAYGPDDM